MRYIRSPAGEGVRDEALHGFGCAVQVTAGQLRAAEVQLPRDTVGHRSQRGVQHVAAGVAGRAPDRRLLVVVDGGHHRLDRGLGGAVTVEGSHAGAGALVPDERPGAAAQCFTTEGEHGQRHPRQQTRGPQLSKHRRGGVDHVDAVLGDGSDQCLGVGLGVFVDDVHDVTVEQRHQRLPGRVERERPCVRNAQRTAQPGRRRSQHMVQMIIGVGADRGVSSDDALGFPGCSRGEHHVGGLTGIDLDGLEIAGAVGARSRRR